MAKLIAGRIIGKVGDLIFGSKNGVTYVKRAPKKSSKGPTPKQLIHRERFGMVMRFLSPLRGILNESYLRKNHKTTGLNTAVKHLLAEAITGEYPDLKIDYSKVSLIRGHLRSPEINMAYSGKLNELHLCWQQVPCANSFLDDELIMLIYCKSLPVTWHEIRTGIMRSEQIASVKLTGQLQGHEIHIWLAYQSAMMESFSDSVYMGQVFTQNSDGHENT